MTEVINQEHWDCGCTLDLNTRRLVRRCKIHAALLPENTLIYKHTGRQDFTCPNQASAHFIIHGDGRIEQKRPIDPPFEPRFTIIRKGA